MIFDFIWVATRMDGFMRDLLRTRGLRVTPQRELVFRSFIELGRHVSVNELYDKVRAQDGTVGYSTVWRNLKLICEVGLAEEVNLGDGVTRYDRVTQAPHGHLYCTRCRELVEFDVARVKDLLAAVSSKHGFLPDAYKIEILGVCASCLEKDAAAPDNDRGKKRR
jgi:Fur family transcriptional regulator, ferric uptake regulator